MEIKVPRRIGPWEAGKRLAKRPRLGRYEHGKPRMAADPALTWRGRGDVASRSANVAGQVRGAGG